MSTYDEYEHRRGPVRRSRDYHARAFKAQKALHAKPKDPQLGLKLTGGTTAKDKGAPFDDPIPF